MSKIAFIFPGQGSQYIGMARDFYGHFQESRVLFEKASEVTGYPMEAICFDENDKIHQTRYTQPALLTAACAILAAVEADGIHGDMTAGLSLGEYCALTAAKALAFEEAVKVVRERGIYMEEAVPSGDGCMAAVISRKPLPVEQICMETEGLVSVANYNCPGQQVITGERTAVETASAKLMEAGAFRVVPLKVSGPFHSQMLDGAGMKLRMLLDTIPIGEPVIPFVSNVTAKGVKEPDMIRELLGKQVCSPVLWQQSITYMIDAGVDTFIEIGPGKTLSGFVKKISRTVRTFHVERPDDLEKVKADLF